MPGPDRSSQGFIDLTGSEGRPCGNSGYESSFSASWPLQTHAATGMKQGYHAAPCCPMLPHTAPYCSHCNLVPPQGRMHGTRLSHAGPQSPVQQPRLWFWPFLDQPLCSILTGSDLPVSRSPARITPTTAMAGALHNLRNHKPACQHPQGSPVFATHAINISKHIPSMDKKQTAQSSPEAAQK